jgi:Ring finger domain
MSNLVAARSPLCETKTTMRKPHSPSLVRLTYLMNLATLFLPLHLLLTPVSAVTYFPRDPCTVEDMDVVVLQRQGVNPAEFSVVKRLGPNADITNDGEFFENGQVRTLTSEEDVLLTYYWEDETSIVEAHGRLGGGIRRRGLIANVSNETEVSMEDSEYFFARECRCFYPRSPVVYCPMTIDTCLRGSWGAPPGCRDLAKGTAFGWSFQIFLLLWFLILFLCLFQRKGMGANFRDYVLNLCVPKYSERLADLILQHNPQRARELYLSYFLHLQVEMFQRRQWTATVVSDAAVIHPQQEGQRREQAQSGLELPEMTGGQPAATSSNAPTALMLRTRVFHSSATTTTTQNTTDDVECCTICFAELVDGDRVGILEVCNHQFHVDCLKPWLQRRNACPLCQKEGIAKPHYQESNNNSNAATSSEITSLQSITSSMDVDQGTAGGQDQSHDSG